MRNIRLIDRQMEIARALTSAELIFGDGKALADDPTFWGMSIPHLKLEAEMSFDKRSAQLRKTFRRTFSLLGRDLRQILRRFAAACPPQTYRRYEDSVDFYRFVTGYWETTRPRPAHVADVAKFEMAVARAGTFVTGGDDRSAAAVPPGEVRAWAIRLAPGAEVVRLTYDLRPLFDKGGSAGGSVRRRTNWLLIAQPAGGDRQLRITEIPGDLGAILESPPEGWADYPGRAADAGSASAGTVAMLVSAGVLRRSD